MQEQTGKERERWRVTWIIGQRMLRVNIKAVGDPENMRRCRDSDLNFLADALVTQTNASSACPPNEVKSITKKEKAASVKI